MQSIIESMCTTRLEMKVYNGDKLSHIASIVPHRGKKQYLKVS